MLFVVFILCFVFRIRIISRLVAASLFITLLLVACSPNYEVGNKAHDSGNYKTEREVLEH